MKNLVVILFVLFAASAFAQDSTAVKEAGIKALTNSGHLMVFVGNDMSKTDDFQLYLQHNLNCKYNRDTHSLLKGGEVLYKYSYTRSLAGEKAPTPLIVNFTVNKNNLIKKVVITGDRVDLAELFLFYWPTKVTAEQIRKERVAVERLLTDKITYQANGNNGTITITHL